jgi:pteridine reductase
MQIDPTKYPLAIVTGAGRRVGKAIALHLAVKGYAVVVHYLHSENEALETCREITRLGRPSFPIKADLAAGKGAETLFEKVKDIPNPLMLLVNSAAVMPKSSLVEMTGGDWDRVMNINSKAVWQCSKLAAQQMDDVGVIINLSDVGVQLNWTQYGGYIVSKAAVETITRLMARELAPRIRVCGIAPGLLMKNEEMPGKKWDTLKSRIPAGKSVSLEDLFQVIDLLIDNGYITGEIITLAGGSQLG